MRWFSEPIIRISGTIDASSITLQALKPPPPAIQGGVDRTKAERSLTLSHLTGAEVYLKFENHQFTASFKERGALKQLLSLTEEARNGEVIAMSAGNHAQGVAITPRRLGVDALIVMPRRPLTSK